MTSTIYDEEEEEFGTAPSGFDATIANGKRILVVEDDECVAHYLVELLTEYRCVVFGPASSGGQAIDLALATRPDLALIDIGLKGPMDGIHTALELRSRWAIPAIFLSGTVDPVTFERARQASPVDFIHKPYLPPRLEEVLRKAFPNP